jgi:hypothetical protein
MTHSMFKKAHVCLFAARLIPSHFHHKKCPYLLCSRFRRCTLNCKHMCTPCPLDGRPHHLRSTKQLTAVVNVRHRYPFTIEKLLVQEFIWYEPNFWVPPHHSLSILNVLGHYKCHDLSNIHIPKPEEWKQYIHLHVWQLCSWLPATD